VALGGDGRLAEPTRHILDKLPTAGRGSDERTAALVFDASGIADTAGLRALYDFFHPVIRSLRSSGRVIVLGSPPELCPSAREATAQQALEGFVRSLGKEIGRGSTAQLLYVAPGAEEATESTLRFLLSGRSAYVSGQVIRIGPAAVDVPDDWDRPLVGKTAIVTGAARGIGAAIARVLTREGAHVVCLDVPAAGEDLAGVANGLKGTALQLDLTAEDAPRRLADFIATRHVHADVFVHNAGITRDKTLGRMDEGQWASVIDVNLGSQERINDVLLAEGLLGGNGRIVSVSSVSGIAGNRGQTNYATSKAGVIGLVRASAGVVAEHGLTINAVAPGFIETKMTAAMPMFVREGGRRLNSLAQGGLPVDVAETIAWLAGPASGGVNGNVVRVCGQSLLGA
jgi:3-oxoacyl-[acyl-carrier protein] reductase